MHEIIWPSMHGPFISNFLRSEYIYNLSRYSCSDVRQFGYAMSGQTRTRSIECSIAANYAQREKLVIENECPIFVTGIGLEKLCIRQSFPNPDNQILGVACRGGKEGPTAACKAHVTCFEQRSTYTTIFPSDDLQVDHTVR